MWPYLAVFLAALAVDSIPVIAPPAWMAMVILLIKFKLNPWIVIPIGVAGSTLGRYLMSFYVGKFAKRHIKRHKREELEFLGKKLGQKLWHSWLFVFLYTVTPLSSTALFTAAGIAKVKPGKTLPPFFAGKFLSDSLMVFCGSYAAKDIKSIVQGTYSPKGVLFAVLGLVVVGVFLFFDWRELLQHKKFKFSFRIWK